jgi:hypothetical protein
VRHADLVSEGETTHTGARPAIRIFTGAPMPARRVVLPAGTLLEAQPHIALFAALGLTELSVHGRLQVAIFSTGDEVVEPGSPRAAAIYNANCYLLRTLLERLAAVVTNLGSLADELGELARWPRLRPGTISSSPRAACRPASRPCAQRGRAHRQPGVLARRHKAGAAGCHGRDPCRARITPRTAPRPSSGYRGIRLPCS